MTAIMALIRVDVSYVMGLEYQMPTTASLAANYKKIEMDVRRSSIWEVLGLIFFIKERNLGLIRSEKASMIYFVNKN